MQDELANQIIEQLRSLNSSLKSIVKRLDRIESTVKKPRDVEELVILPRSQPSVPEPARRPGGPPIIESRRQ